MPPSDVLVRLAELPLVVEDAVVDYLERRVSDGSYRRSAVLHLRGGGEEGVGEDVTFQPSDLLAAPPAAPWATLRTLGDLWSWLDDADLLERSPEFDVVRSYRRWAVEAAALDLALRQARRSFADVVGCAPAPVRLVVSPAPSPTSLKSTIATGRPGPSATASSFRTAVAYARARPLGRRPRLASRSADRGQSQARPCRQSLRARRALYAAGAERGISVYGGGQVELGPGRGQAQLLAALFHPDAPNDLAPSGYNDANPPATLPRSPLVLAPDRGFRTL